MAPAMNWWANPYHAQLGFSPAQARYWDVEACAVNHLLDDLERCGGLDKSFHWKLVWRPLQVGREGRYVLVTRREEIALPMSFPKGYRGAIIERAREQETRLRPVAWDGSRRVLEYRGSQ
jgi:hypothetical protein